MSTRVMISMNLSLIRQMIRKMKRKLMMLFLVKLKIPTMK